MMARRTAGWAEKGGGRLNNRGDDDDDHRQRQGHIEILSGEVQHIAKPGVAAE